MFNEGGRPSAAPRREVDLYVHVDDIAEFAHRRTWTRSSRPHDTFYGMRELIVRDLNGFWLTFVAPMSPTF
jgi:hypothetical protein